MTKYREIIRLTGLGFSQRNIMASCGVSQKTVVKVQKRARELNISWPLDESMTDTELQKLMFSKESKVSANKRIPDYAYIRKELLRNGVSKKLLWTEYMEDCRANGDEPLMYSQFCYHIQQDKQKHRATMHINRKPGEQVEVDWAGDPATIIDTAKKEIYKMLENGEKVTVTKLIEQTGLSRGFFYKNEEVRALLDRAVEQQAGMVSPKRYIGNIAQKRKIELLEEQNEKLLKEMAALQEENNRLKKALGKRALNTIKNL